MIKLLQCTKSTMSMAMPLLILCNNILPCESKSRRENELSDALFRFVQFAPILFGDTFTKQEEELYDAGTKLEDVHLEIHELITKHGYPVEEYEVVTKDGYILRVFRIRGEGRPVLLMHGMFLSADDFVSTGPGSGLAYLLAAAGLDVWLGNARGTKHSRAHASLTPRDAAFWDFSWDEIGRYDLPAIIELVLRTTRRPRLVFVGHSQGATAFFVMASERPEYNDKVSLMVALGPAADVPNLKSPLLQILKFIVNTNIIRFDTVMAVLRNFGLYEFPQTNVFTEAFSYNACAESKIAKGLCKSLVFLMCGINTAQINFTSLPTVLSHMSSGVSLKQIEHYAQTIVDQRFARYDYGEKKNMVLYGSTFPPDYNLSAITTPVAILYSVSDWFVSNIDVHILRKKLLNVVDFHKIPDENFTHLDFVYAKNVRELIFTPMLRQIQKLP